MPIKVFNYELWRDKETGAYYTRFNNNTVEVTKEQYYELMSHENADRYSERRDKLRLQSTESDIDKTLSDESQNTEQKAVDKIMFSELLARFNETDRIIIQYFLTKEMTAREIEKEYHIPRSTVSRRGKKLLIILEKIYEKRDKSDA